MTSIDTYTDDVKDATIKLILGILESEFNHVGIDRPDIHNIPEIYQRGKGNFWVATDNGQIIGTIALEDYGNGRGYLKRMYVSKNHRGSGLAQQLLETQLDFARIQHYQTIFLGTTEDMKAANKFYQKQGFARIPSLPEGLPHFGDTVFYKLELLSGPTS